MFDTHIKSAYGNSYNSNGCPVLVYILVRGGRQVVVVGGEGCGGEEATWCAMFGGRQHVACALLASEEGGELAACGRCPLTSKEGGKCSRDSRQQVVCALRPAGLAFAPHTQPCCTGLQCYGSLLSNCFALARCPHVAPLQQIAPLRNASAPRLGRQRVGLPHYDPPSSFSVITCFPVMQGRLMVRHTKRQVLGGEEVLRLPPKTEETVAGGYMMVAGWPWLATPVFVARGRWVQVVDYRQPLWRADLGWAAPGAEGSNIGIMLHTCLGASPAPTVF